MEKSSGKLYIVSTPIGHPGDITLRAIEVLKEADIVVCEELRDGGRLLHQLGIRKELLALNEHNAKAASEEAIEMLREGKVLALVSDCGTPLLADPGRELVDKAILEEIEVHPIPGASSVLAALVVCGFSMEQFLFAGFLPRDKAARKRAARNFREHRETLVFLEAPYRLNQLLADLAEGIGSQREAALAMNLTLKSEAVQRGTLGELESHFAAHPFKGEFVLVVKGARSRQNRGNYDE